jgi:hypothetical protein
MVVEHRQGFLPEIDCVYNHTDVRLAVRIQEDSSEVK